MKCPNCSRDIADTTIICPYCNTQFAFSAPGSVQNKSQELYEEIEENVSVPSPNQTSLPTEPIYNNEEEINPEDMRYYVDEQVNNEETMHIYGKPIEINDNVPIDPMNMGKINPIRPEAPNNTIGNNQTNINTTFEPSTPVITSAPINNNNNLLNSTVNQPPINNTVVNQVQIPVNNQAQTVTNNSNVNRSSTLRTAAVSTSNLIPPSSPVSNRVESYMNEQVQPSNGNNPQTVRTLDSTIGVANIQDRTKQKKKDEMFFMAVIIIGCFVLTALIFVMIYKNSEKTSEGADNKVTKTTTKLISNNTGIRSTFNYPLYTGNTALASYYDKENKKYTEVDVLGSRFINGTEANELANIYAKEPLNEGFEWVGFEYKITFNDLEYLKDQAISPIIESKIYRWNGCDFFNYNSKNYMINITSIYEGDNIKNKESATVKVLFQVPAGEKQYSICFGNIDKTIGCFANDS